MVKNKVNIRRAFEKGYRIINGNIISPTGNIRKIENSQKGDMRFGIRDEGNVRVKISVPRLAAYQKFGEVIFKDDVFVYHKDGNQKNNLEDNIVIGTFSEAQMAKPVEVRVKAATIASSHVAKHNHDDIINMHKNGMSYKQIMLKTGIKSKGTISFICSKSIGSKIENE